MRTDSERVDWLGKMAAPDMYEYVKLMSNYLTDDEETAYTVELSEACDFLGYTPTLREAIDSAMDADEGGRDEDG